MTPSMLRKPLLALAAAVSLFAVVSCRTYTSREQAVPTAQYLQHTPQYIPPATAFPVTREVTSTEMRKAPPVVGGPVPPPIPSAVPPLPASPAPDGVAALAPLPPQPVPAGGRKARLTVANVRGVGAQLFTVSPAGELTYVDSVSAGDAIDVETTTGTRWAAVFGEKPHSQSFQVTLERGIWLLRGPRERTQTTSGSQSPSMSSH